jgi:hypothetical protein
VQPFFVFNGFGGFVKAVEKDWFGYNVGDKKDNGLAGLQLERWLGGRVECKVTYLIDKQIMWRHFGDGIWNEGEVGEMEWKLRQKFNLQENFQLGEPAF